MENIRIKSVAIYHPENKVNNEFYLNHFDNQGKDIRRLLEGYGRNERYIVDNDFDNTATMGAKASLRALKEANLRGEDIDIILFSSSMPEFTAPTQALFVHSVIKGKAEAMVMDTNVNCVGMIASVDTAVRYLQTNDEYKRALIIGSDYMSVHCKDNDELTYPQFGDLACAVILEKTTEDSAFLGSKYLTNSDEWGIVRYPNCGTSKAYDDIHENEKKLFWTPFDGSFICNHAKDSIDFLLHKNNLKMEDIKLFCVSQFAKGIGLGCIEAFGVDDSKVPYIGDRYGYTGTSSPFLVLHEMIKEGKINRGDYVAFWSVGTNWTTSAVLIKY